MLFIIKVKVTPQKSKKILMEAKSFDECYDTVQELYGDRWDFIEYNSKFSQTKGESK